MEYEEFLRRVAERGGLVEGEEPDDVVGAVLVTLSERVPDAECRSLAEQLPHEVGQYMTAADGAESFDYGEFVSRVQEREETVDRVDRAVVEQHAAAVVSVLLEAVAPRKSDDLLPHLTADFEPLFDLVDPEEVWGPGWHDRLGQRA